MNIRSINACALGAIPLIVGGFFVGGSSLFAQDHSAAELIGKVAVGNAPQPDSQLNVPVILWGGEAATFWANGGVETKSDSVFGQLGLKMKLSPGDDSVQQARDYLTGKSPLYRGTFRMGCLFSEVFNQDARTKPVCILQLTFSLGDHVVGRDTVKTLNDLKGKKICLQQGGPHLGLVEDSLKAAALSWNDITVVWAKDLTGENGPAEMMRRDPAIDAACVVTPDMIGLCSGIDQTGSGAEGTIEGAHVVNSTASMSRSIADMYWARSDFYNSPAGKSWCEKFVVGYLKATEQMLAARTKYDDGQGQAPEYVKVMNLMQKFYGEDVLPTIEEDVHGLILDANFVRIPGNEIFFNDPNNPTGFKAKQTSGLDLAVRLGYAKKKLGFTTAKWDYKAISKAAGVEYTAPVYAQGRIKAEVTDFGEDLDDSTIFSFEINFEPEQRTFPLESYAADFKRFTEVQATFANAAIIIEGHSDPTLALQQFFWAAKSKGLITGSKGNYKFRGRALALTDTDAVIRAIQSENLSGQSRKNRSGQTVAIDDPKQTVAAALQLSKARATEVKNVIEKFAHSNDYQIDMSAVIPHGVGISDPINSRPRNMQQAKENMRVVFRIVRVRAEAVSSEDFDFEE
jgi:hypothetical protein